MNKTIKSQLIKLDKKEFKFLNRQPGILKQKTEPLIEELENKIPKGLRENLEKAFEKAFKIIFEKGTDVIEKITPKDNISFEHTVNDFAFKNDNGFFSKTKHLKRIDQNATKRSLIGKSTAFVEGAGLGLLGVGIPDIPIFIGVLLKGIYETSLSYGFNYNLPSERIFILKLIQVATTENFEKHGKNLELNNWEDYVRDCKDVDSILEKEIQNTAQSLAEYMLVAKFIQGIPIIGISGSIFNLQIYSKVSDYATLKYKRRYLQKQNKP